jgi:hypothetical protein
MEKIYDCVQCGEQFRITGVVDASAAIPEVTLNVECPFCHALNEVTWPQGAAYFVGPAI